MKAGTALGLLAGLGAMNALRGGRDGTGPRFTGLIDMFDGGGAGQSGDKFEGGGLLSMLGNLFMKPMQAQQNVERIADKVRAEKSVAEKLGMTTGTPITEYSDSLLAPIVNPDVYGIGEGGEFAGTPTVVPSDLPNLSPRLDGKDGDISSGLTDAQKEDIVMSQSLQPSQAALGILAQPQAQLQSPDGLFAGKGTFSETTAPTIQSDPMGLLSPNTPTQGKPSLPSSPNVMIDGPTAPNETQVMLQSLMGTVPQGVGDLTKQDYADYVMAGGRLPYSEYEKTTPEYRATQQLSEQYDTFYMMPVEEQMRLIQERADILRRETPKNVPFTGPAF